MKAEFYKWYDCLPGTMPEDFENVGLKVDVVIACRYDVDPTSRICLCTDYRKKDPKGDILWLMGHSSDTIYLSWMLVKLPESESTEVKKSLWERMGF